MSQSCSHCEHKAAPLFLLKENGANKNRCWGWWFHHLNQVGKTGVIFVIWNNMLIFRDLRYVSNFSPSTKPNLRKITKIIIFMYVLLLHNNSHGKDPRTKFKYEANRQIQVNYGKTTKFYTILLRKAPGSVCTPLNLTLQTDWFLPDFRNVDKVSGHPQS